MEFALSLLDHRLLAGTRAVYERFAGSGSAEDAGAGEQDDHGRAGRADAERHKKYGDTLFHLEPSIKDCPGGLRDVHVCGWMKTLAEAGSERSRKRRQRTKSGLAAGDREEFRQAVEFLFLVRCFLHYRHERDDNTLDWQAQDAAAKALIGPGTASGRRAEGRRRTRRTGCGCTSAMRGAWSGRLTQMLEVVPAKQRRGDGRCWARLLSKARRPSEPAPVGFRVEGGRAVLGAASSAAGDPAQDPEVVLQLFAAMSRTGMRAGSGERGADVAGAAAAVGASGGRARRCGGICGRFCWAHYAGNALRAMHALGILELLIPEFHGIDALVIRDAYHRYTVDEHTMVLIDTLHGLETPQTGPMGEWAARFGGILRDVQHQELLYLGGVAA